MKAGFVIVNSGFTALRTLLIKGNSKMKMYRDYKTFNIEIFKKDLGEREFTKLKHL